MRHRLKIGVFIAILVCGVAHAGLVPLPVPTGVVAANGSLVLDAATGRMWTQAAATAGARATVSTIATVGSRSVAVPIAMEAASVLGGVVARAAFANPAIVAAATLFTLYNHFNKQGFSVNPTTNQWEKDEVYTETGIWYQVMPGGSSIPDPAKFSTPSSACSAYSSKVYPSNSSSSRSYSYDVPTHTCIVKSTRISDGYSESFGSGSANKYTGQVEKTRQVPATEPDMDIKMSPLPVPPDILNNWPVTMPPLPVPVMPVPVINPDPVTNLPSTLRVPTGLSSPVPVGELYLGPDGVYYPRTAGTPVVYKTPVVDLVPANDAKQPFLIDIQPKVIYSPAPIPTEVKSPVPYQTPYPVPDPVTTKNPDGSTETTISNPDGSKQIVKVNPDGSKTVTNIPAPLTDPNLPPVPPNKPPSTTTATPNPCTNDPTCQACKDFCLENPTRLGCVLIGTAPSPEKLTNKNIALTFESKVFPSSATCPAPLTFEAFGTHSFKYDPICDFLTSMRALMLAIAAILAAYILADGFRIQ